MSDYLWVCLGAGIGAPARYVTDRVVRARYDPVLPWGTIAVNLVGSFVLGVVMGSGASETVVLAVGTGFCGALTTWSTFGYETVRLAEDGGRRAAVLNVVVSLCLGLGAALAGLALGSW